MSDSKPSCAHLNVGYLPDQHADGTQSDNWVCEVCGRKFIPRPIGTDISRMTLGELEQAGARMHKAAADIRAAQAMFRPPATVGAGQEVGLGQPFADEPTAPPVEEDPAAAHRRRQFQPVEGSQPRVLRTNHPAGGLSAAERAERQRIIERQTKAPVDPNLPEDIQQAERGE